MSELTDDRLREIEAQPKEGAILRPKDADRHEVQAMARELLALRAAASTRTEEAGEYARVAEFLRENELTALPWPLAPFDTYKAYLPTAKAIVQEYTENWHDLRRESRVTDIWAVAEEVLAARIAEAIALTPPAPKVTTDEAEERG